MCILFFLILVVLNQEWVELYSGSEFDKVEKSQMAGPRDLELVSIIGATKVSIKHILVSGFLFVSQITFLCPLEIKSHGSSE